MSGGRQLSGRQASGAAGLGSLAFSPNNGGNNVRPPVFLLGRSIGATCAVHLAAKDAQEGTGLYQGLILEAGLMDLMKIPLVLELGRMMPQAIELLNKSPNPLQTHQKIQHVKCPTLFLHGDEDKMVPLVQSQTALNDCGAPATEKRLRRFPRRGHNDLSTGSSQRIYLEEVKNFRAMVMGEQQATASKTAGYALDVRPSEVPGLVASAGISALQNAVFGVFSCLPQRSPRPPRSASLPLPPTAASSVPKTPRGVPTQEGRADIVDAQTDRSMGA